MKKYKIVKKNDDFNFIISKGQKKSTKNILMFYVDNKVLKYDTNHIGFTVSKKNKTAVARNYNKRLLRELVNKNFDMLPKDKTLIFIGKFEMDKTKFEKLDVEMKRLLKGVK